MPDVRYEEYSGAANGIPFILNDNLDRTPLTCSTAANWHENIELQICCSGSGTVLIDGTRHPFEVDDIILINSGAIHYTRTDAFLNYSCILLDSTFCRHAGFEPTALFFEPRFRDPACLALCREIVRIYNTENTPHRCAKLQVLTLRLLIHISDAHTVSTPHSKGIPEHDMVKSAIRYIRANYQSKITLDTLAAVVYTDKYHLTRIFRQLTQQTIVNYINQYRCRIAMSMIIDGSSVSAAAEACGFHNMSFFTKTFRRHIGCLPSEYIRRRC